MNAFRKFRMLALVAMVAVLLVGIAGTSADAGCHGYGYGYSSYSPSYCAPSFYGYSSCYTPAYSPCYYPTYYAQPVYLNSCYGAYPVTYLP
jgi:hypothetical protein